MLLHRPSDWGICMTAHVEIFVTTVAEAADCARLLSVGGTPARIWVGPKYVAAAFEKEKESPLRSSDPAGKDWVQHVAPGARQLSLAAAHAGGHPASRGVATPTTCAGPREHCSHPARLEEDSAAADSGESGGDAAKCGNFVDRRDGVRAELRRGLAAKDRTAVGGPGAGSCNASPTLAQGRASHRRRPPPTHRRKSSGGTAACGQGDASTGSRSCDGAGQTAVASSEVGTTTGSEGRASTGSRSCDEAGHTAVASSEVGTTTGSRGRASTGSRSCDGAGQTAVASSAVGTTTGSEGRASGGETNRCGTDADAACEAAEAASEAGTSRGGTDTLTGSQGCDGEAARHAAASEARAEREGTRAGNKVCHGGASQEASKALASAAARAGEVSGQAHTEEKKQEETATCRPKAGLGPEFTLPAELVIQGTFIELRGPRVQVASRAASAPPALGSAFERVQHVAAAAEQPLAATTETLEGAAEVEHFLLTPRAGQQKLCDGSSDGEPAAQPQGPQADGLCVSGDGVPATDELSDGSSTQAVAPAFRGDGVPATVCSPSSDEPKLTRALTRHLSDESTAPSTIDAGSNGGDAPAGKASGEPDSLDLFYVSYDEAVGIEKVGLSWQDRLQQRITETGGFGANLSSPTGDMWEKVYVATRSLTVQIDICKGTDSSCSSLLAALVQSLRCACHEAEHHLLECPAAACSGKGKSGGRGRRRGKH